MDGFNKDGKVDIYRDKLDGKTDEEIVEICEAYLGDFDGRKFDNNLVNRDNFARLVALDNLRDAINEMREDKVRYTPEDRESVLKDFGMTGEKTPISAIANRVLQEEATEIVKQGFIRGFGDKPMDKEELERRIKVVKDFCAGQTLDILMQKTVPRFYYGYDAKDTDDIDRINKDLPQFFQAVDYLVSNGVDISKIQMEKDMNLQEVYMEVSQKYAKFFSKDNKEALEVAQIEEQEKPKTVSDIFPEEDKSSEMAAMVNDTQDTNSNMEDLMRQIQRNQAEMQRIMEENAKLIAKLQEMQMANSNQTQR